jgi:predicted MarR family transcription regulator
MNQASYDLARLHRNGLIERIARTNTYRLTADGLTFALVYSRVHDQVLYP